VSEDHIVVTDERTTFVRAINSGRPLITTDPAADSSLAIAKLAYRSSAAEMETDGITKPSQLLTMARSANWSEHARPVTIRLPVRRTGTVAVSSEVFQ
jgi:hypothetical protein